MDDDESTGSDLTVVEWFDEPTAAAEAAARLVESGVGAVIDDASPPQTGVAVLGSDETRAREILGLAEPAPTTEDDELKGYSRPWLVPVLVFAIAMVVVPLLAFYIAFKLSGG